MLVFPIFLQTWKTEAQKIKINHLESHKCLLLNSRLETRYPFPNPGSYVQTRFGTQYGWKIVGNEFGNGDWDKIVENLAWWTRLFHLYLVSNKKSEMFWICQSCGKSCVLRELGGNLCWRREDCKPGDPRESSYGSGRKVWGSGHWKGRDRFSRGKLVGLGG